MPSATLEYREENRYVQSILKEVFLYFIPFGFLFDMLPDNLVARSGKWTIDC